MGKPVFAAACWLVALLAVLSVSCTPAASPSPSPAPSAPAAPTRAAPAPPPASAAPAAAPTLAPLSPPVTVKLGTFASVGDGALYIAQDKGYFKEQGLQVEMTDFAATAETIPLLASGQLQVSRGVGSAGLFNAMIRGIPLRIVADNGRAIKGFNHLALVLRKDLVDSGQIKDYGDLKGFKFAAAGVGTGSFFERAMHTAVVKGNLTIKDITFTNLANADSMTALGNKSLDGAILPEPLVAQGVERGIFVLWKGLEDLLPNEQHTWLIYAPSFAEGSPEAARRFMVAYLKAARDYMEAIAKGKGREDVVKILIQRSTVKDPALYQKMGYPGLDPNGLIDKASISRAVEWNTAQGYVTGKLDIDSTVDDRFIQYALKQLGEYK